MSFGNYGFTFLIIPLFVGCGRIHLSSKIVSCSERQIKCSWSSYLILQLVVVDHDCCGQKGFSVSICVCLKLKTLCYYRIISWRRSSGDYPIITVFSVFRVFHNFLDFMTNPSLQHHHLHRFHTHLTIETSFFIKLDTCSNVATDDGQRGSTAIL